MNKINMAILALATLLLSGCVFSMLNLGSKTILEVKFVNDTYDVHIVKLNPNSQRNCPSKFKKNHKVWGFTCKYNNPPNQLNLEYAKLGITFQQYHQLPTDPKRQEILENMTHSLPPSAWRTYTVNLKPIQDEVNRLYRTDPRGTYKFGAKATVTLYIDGNGNISQEVDYDRVTKGWLL